MTFSAQIDIAKPVAHVWNAFTDRARLAKWQQTLRAVEPVSGAAGEVGTVTRLTYREAGRDVVMSETVLERRAPAALACRLTSRIMDSTIANAFVDLEGATRWVVTCEIKFRGVWRLVGLFGRRMIIRKTESDMRRFKEFTEGLPEPA